jgi:hypothetical protein
MTFILSCPCGWREETTGFSKDISHLDEIKSGCSKCGKPRVFRCPKCRGRAKMIRKVR